MPDSIVKIRLRSFKLKTFCYTISYHVVPAFLSLETS